MKTKEITISENTAALMQSLKEMHAAYFKALSIMEKQAINMEKQAINDNTGEAWNALNKAFRNVIGQSVYNAFVESEYTQI